MEFVNLHNALSISGAVLIGLAFVMFNRELSTSNSNRDRHEAKRLGRLWAYRVEGEPLWIVFVKTRWSLIGNIGAALFLVGITQAWFQYAQNNLRDIYMQYVATVSNDSPDYERATIEAEFFSAQTMTTVGYGAALTYLSELQSRTETAGTDDASNQARQQATQQLTLFQQASTAGLRQASFASLFRNAAATSGVIAFAAGIVLRLIVAMSNDPRRSVPYRGGGSDPDGSGPDADNTDDDPDGGDAKPSPEAELGMMGPIEDETEQDKSPIPAAAFAGHTS